MTSHNEIYFDNSATTKVLDSVKDIVVKTMTETTAILLPDTVRGKKRKTM